MCFSGFFLISHLTALMFVSYSVIHRHAEGNMRILCHCQIMLPTVNAMQPKWSQGSNTSRWKHYRYQSLEVLWLILTSWPDNCEKGKEKLNRERERKDKSKKSEEEKTDKDNSLQWGEKTRWLPIIRWVTSNPPENDAQQWIMNHPKNSASNIW